MIKTIEGFNKFRIGNLHGMLTENWSSGQVEHFVKSLDELIANGKLFKSDRTSTVSKTSFNDTGIVIKRYNNKGFFHSLKNTLRVSRGQKSWFKSHVLLDIDIYTPSPLGYIVEKKNGQDGCAH